MKKKCLFVNPISNGKKLAAYFKERGAEIYLFIEVKKARNVFNGDLPERWIKRIDVSFYSAFYVNIEQVFSSGIQFDCIIPGSESGVETAEFLMAKYNVSGNDPRTTAFRRNKYFMQERIKFNHLSYAKSILIELDKMYLTEKNLEGFSYPVVLKPVASAGMDDVFYCFSLEELNFRLAAVDINKINGVWINNTHFMVQEYLDGDEFALDYVVHNGIATICVVSRYLRNFPVGNKNITTESVFLDPQEPVYSDLIEYGRQVIKALEIRNGAVHAEFIETEHKTCLVDIGARMRGGGDPWFYQEIYAMSLMEAIYDKYINDGKSLKDNVLKRQCIHTVINSSKSGVFTGLNTSEKEKISNLPLVKELSINLDIGQKYARTTGLYNSIGVATIIGDDVIEVRRTVYELYNILKDHFGDWYQEHWLT